MFRHCAMIVGVLLLMFLAASVQADVFNMLDGQKSLEFVPVGDPGNAGELSGRDAGGDGPDRICGAVDYNYDIGKYEVTAGQYAAFLNAVAHTDPYGLYNAGMWNDVQGCKIQQIGTSGSYTYSVALDYANRPVNYVNFWDACGSPTGCTTASPPAHGAGTTETGAYTLTADGMNNNTIVRNADWKYAVPSEDEWYKAAYYKGGSTNAGFWDFATRSNRRPRPRHGRRLGQQRQLPQWPPFHGLLPYRFGHVLHDCCGRVPELRQPLWHVRPGRQRS